MTHQGTPYRPPPVPQSDRPLPPGVPETHVSVHIHGPLACFTRPEHRAERISYEVITPSAARGVLDAIYWHPKLHWEVRAIEILKPLQTLAVRTNELKKRHSGPTDITRNRAQRMSIILSDVSYVVHADLMVEREHRHDFEKHLKQARERVQSGRCTAQPFLGMRDYAAFFGPADNAPPPVTGSEYLGQLLLDMRWTEDPINGTEYVTFHDREYPGAPEVKRQSLCRAEPVFFDAYLVNGVVIVPPHLYDQVWRTR
jgi:CRISPR-associated protein Cas5d